MRANVTRQWSWGGSIPNSSFENLKKKKKKKKSH